MREDGKGEDRRGRQEVTEVLVSGPTGGREGFKREAHDDVDGVVSCLELF